MEAARADLTTCRDILEISERRFSRIQIFKRTSRNVNVASATNKTNSRKTFSGSSPVSFSYSNKSGKEFKEKDLKDVKCFKCHKKEDYANKCPEIKAKESKEVFKDRKKEEQSEIKSDDKVVRQISMRYSDFADGYTDPFLRYWVLCYGLGPILDLTKNGHLARIFVDTGAYINTITRYFYNMLVNQGLMSKFALGLSNGIEVKLVPNL